MDRIIKFRGLRKDGLSPDFVIGSLIIEPNNRYWIDWFEESVRRTTEVIPETVGQFTGLLDKNGVEIYEGDLVNFYTLRYKDGYEESVSYEEGRLLPFYDDEYIQDECGDWFDYRKGFEIVGNIHQKGAAK